MYGTIKIVENVQGREKEKPVDRVNLKKLLFKQESYFRLSNSKKRKNAEKLFEKFQKVLI